MSDLISKKQLIKELLAERDKLSLTVPPRPYEFGDQPCKSNQLIRGGIRKALRLIETAPTVEAVPVVHGRWVKQNENPPEAVCSECGADVRYQVVDNKLAFEPYCAHCGAKMDGQEDGK